jgi:hypothetical protein
MKYDPQTTNFEGRNTKYLLQIDTYFKYGARTTLYKIRTPNNELEILNTKYNSPNYEL